MKLICEGVELSDAVMKVVKACSAKTTNPILETIKLSAQNDTLTLLATDGEIAIQKKIGAEILEEGAACVPGKYFSDFIKKLENVQLTLTCRSDRLDIVYGDSESSIQVLPAEDFPLIDTDIAEKSFSLPAKDLKDLIARTTFCCAQDDSRPVLKGCLIEAKEGQAVFTALDGYRMAIVKRPALAAEEVRIICPARTLNEIGRMISAEEETLALFVQKNMLLVRIEDTVLTSRLYEGAYVNVGSIVPKSFASEIEADKQVLAESVDRASVLARTDKNSVLTFDIREGSAAITSNTPVGRIEESVPIALEGKDVNISLNSKYIGEALSAAEGEKVRLCFNGAVSPCVLLPKEGDSFLYLILPVRTTA